MKPRKATKKEIEDIEREIQDPSVCIHMEVNPERQYTR